MLSEEHATDLHLAALEASIMVTKAKTTTLMILKEAIEIELINRRY